MSKPSLVHTQRYITIILKINLYHRLTQSQCPYQSIQAFKISLRIITAVFPNKTKTKTKHNHTKLDCHTIRSASPHPSQQTLRNTLLMHLQVFVFVGIFGRHGLSHHRASSSLTKEKSKHDTNQHGTKHTKTNTSDFITRERRR